MEPITRGRINVLTLGTHSREIRQPHLRHPLIWIPAVNRRSDSMALWAIMSHNIPKNKNKKNATKYLIKTVFPYLLNAVIYAAACTVRLTVNKKEVKVLNQDFLYKGLHFYTTCLLLGHLFSCNFKIKCNRQMLFYTAPVRSSLKNETLYNRNPKRQFSVILQRFTNKVRLDH